MSGRDICVQLALVIVTLAVIYGAISSAETNLTALGITSGFSFLERATGWAYSFSLIERSIDDTYARTLTIGLLNTLFVGFISIFFATIFGFVIGTMRDSDILGLKVLSSLYVQIFRNIPLILQVVFLYSILIHFPSPKSAYSVADILFLSNRGVAVPSLNLSLTTLLVIVVSSIVFAVILIRMMSAVWKAIGVWLVTILAVCILAAVGLSPAGSDIVSVPELKGLRFRGGGMLSVELVAMIVGIVFYGAAYIAEVVRGGLDEVPKGLVEAGRSVGLKSFGIWWTIKVPIALRSIVPPLGNQWIFIMKATTVGVAIGFSDLFYIVSTSINQSGQTLELIAILMGSFLAVNFTMAQFINWLNAKLALKGFG